MVGSNKIGVGVSVVTASETVDLRMNVLKEGGIIKAPSFLVELEL